MTKQKPLVIEELCKNGHLAEFREIVSEAIELVNNKDFSVTTRYDDPTSVTEWGTKDCPIRLIRISLVGNSTNYVRLLWDLLHEVGHVLDGDPGNVKPSIQEQIRREGNAWDNARTFIENHYQLLGNYLDDFNTYKNLCLESYYRKLN